jgi:hypothetical protein
VSDQLHRSVPLSPHAEHYSAPMVNDCHVMSSRPPPAAFVFSMPEVTQSGFRIELKGNASHALPYPPPWMYNCRGEPQQFDMDERMGQLVSRKEPTSPTKDKPSRPRSTLINNAASPLPGQQRTTNAVCHLGEIDHLRVWSAETLTGSEGSASQVRLVPTPTHVFLYIAIILSELWLPALDTHSWCNLSHV